MIRAIVAIAGAIAWGVVFVLFLAFTINRAHAQGWEIKEIYAHTFTRHSHGNEKLNNRDWGQGVVLRNGVVLGGYRNSIYQNSRYIGYFWQPTPYIGVVGGVVSGYLPDDKILPFGAIVFTLPVGHWRAHLNVIPAGHQNVANLSIGYAW